MQNLIVNMHVIWESTNFPGPNNKTSLVLYKKYNYKH